MKKLTKRDLFKKVVKRFTKKKEYQFHQMPEPPKHTILGMKYLSPGVCLINVEQADRLLTNTTLCFKNGHSGICTGMVTGETMVKHIDPNEPVTTLIGTWIKVYYNPHLSIIRALRKNSQFVISGCAFVDK